jgi:hypothetical protein
MPVGRERSDRVDEPIFRVPECIPLFPLPNVVFFPKTYLPLHIFEPRYREMVADIRQADRCVGMVLLKDGWKHDYYGNPPVYEMGCVGRLVSIEELPDGRFNIMLQGVERYAIREQQYDRSYRLARIHLKPTGRDPGSDGPGRAELLSIAGDYLERRRDDQPWQHLWRPDLDPELLVNGFSTLLDLTPLEKQFLLEADSLAQRTHRLIDLLRFKIDERDGVKGWS